MVSFVIASKDSSKRITHVQDFCKKYLIDRFDISIIQRDLTAKPVPQSIGIEDVKQMQKKLFLKPMRSKTKAVVIEEAHLLTPEAQNALLKVLEEPPAQTIIILSANSKEALLPTILSRCQIILLEEERKALSEKERTEFENFVKQLPTLSVGERLKQAEKIAKEKDKAMAWIEKLILVLREHVVILVNEVHPESLSAETKRDPGQARMTSSIRALQTLHTTLKTTNVNARFAIEQTLLQI